MIKQTLKIIALSFLVFIVLLIYVGSVLALMSWNTSSHADTARTTFAFAIFLASIFLLAITFYFAIKAFSPKKVILYAAV